MEGRQAFFFSIGGVGSSFEFCCVFGTMCMSERCRLRRTEKIDNIAAENGFYKEVNGS